MSWHPGQVLLREDTCPHVGKRVTRYTWKRKAKQKGGEQG